MKVKKAIQILTLMGTPEFDSHREDILAARNLGIEALKREQKHREGLIWTKPELLPGETPKDE